MAILITYCVVFKGTSSIYVSESYTCTLHSIEVYTCTLLFCILGDIKNFADDYCLALLLKAVCLRYSGSYLQAEQCYTEILTL